MKQVSAARATLAFFLLVWSFVVVISPRPAAAAGNQPPNACLSVTPQQGTVQTSFSFDASCSTDDRTPVSQLQVRWDWNGDGVWDTALTKTKTATHTYASEGNRTIRVLVQDSQGLTGTFSRTVLVAPILGESSFGGEFLGFPLATEPDIDVNPTNPLSLAIGAGCCATSQTGMVPYPAFYSTDGGRSVTQAYGIGPNEQVGDPALEFDADGRSFFTENVPIPGNTMSPGVFVARSEDGGVTFPSRTYALESSSTFTLPGGGTTHGCAAGTPPYDYPKIRTDKSTSPYRNYLYVVSFAFLDQDNDGACDSIGLVFVRSTDHGLTWNSGQVLENGWSLGKKIVVAANGTIHLGIPVAASDPRCGSRAGIVLHRSTDGGATFTGGTCIFADATGEAQPTSVWPAAHPSDPSKLYLAFTGLVGSLSTPHIFFMKSSDGGDTWTAPVRIDDIVLDDHVDHREPSLAVSATGRLDLAWFDWRNSSPPIESGSWQPSDVYHSFSIDSGATWAGTSWGTSNIRLTPVTASTFRGGGNDFLTTVSTGATSYVAYSQDRSNVHIDSGYVAILQYH